MGGFTSKQERHVNAKSRGRRERESRSGENDERETEREWRRERNRLQEEVNRLRKEVEVKAEQSKLEWWVVEQMCMERAVRDEAAERWKKLYLAIKYELDDLIHITYGKGLYPRPEEELRKEMKVKEETIERLKDRIALIEKQQYDKEREIDILRQSLRIVSSNNTVKKKKKKKPVDIQKLMCQTVNEGLRKCNICRKLSTL